MIDSYDLFAAMNGIDENLVARCDFRVRQKHQSFVSLLPVAACAVIILISAFSLLLASEPQSLAAPPTEPSSTATSPVDSTERPLQLSGSDVGPLHMIQLSDSESTSHMPVFLMNVNMQKYRIAEGGGIQSASARQLHPLGKRRRFSAERHYAGCNPGQSLRRRGQKSGALLRG